MTDAGPEDVEIVYRQEFAHGKETSADSSHEILREEFLAPLKLIPHAVAAALHVPRTRIERIAREEKPVTADTALRLGKFFKTGAAFWMNIQARYDLETAEDVLAPQIKKIASYKAA
jgi:addiction module HigA family antidote